MQWNVTSEAIFVNGGIWRNLMNFKKFKGAEVIMNEAIFGDV